MFLTPKEKQLYTQLVREYNSSPISNICSLDRFFKSKYENSGYLTSYYNVWKFAQNNQ